MQQQPISIGKQQYTYDAIRSHVHCSGVGSIGGELKKSVEVLKDIGSDNSSRSAINNFPVVIYSTRKISNFLVRSSSKTVTFTPGEFVYVALCFQDAI